MLYTCIIIDGENEGLSNKNIMIFKDNTERIQSSIDYNEIKYEVVIYILIYKYKISEVIFLDSKSDDYNITFIYYFCF